MKNYHRYFGMYRAKTFDEALEKAERLCSRWRIWTHTASLYVHPAETEKIAKHAEAARHTSNPNQHTVFSRRNRGVSTTLNWHIH